MKLSVKYFIIFICLTTLYQKGNYLINNKLELIAKARKIKIVLTDNDGVLTDSGVYYTAGGEIMKRFSIRDGMGVERLKNILNINTVIITGENSGSVKKRAEKLLIEDVFLGVKDKVSVLNEVLNKYNLKPENAAFIGDDVNDLEIIKSVGLSASPADGFEMIRQIVDFVCKNNGGNGAFREFAEFIISAQQK